MGIWYLYFDITHLISKLVIKQLIVKGDHHRQNDGLPIILQTESL